MERSPHDLEVELGRLIGVRSLTAHFLENVEEE